MFGFRKSGLETYTDFEREAIPLMGDVYRVAMWLVRDVTEAQDLTQETFIQALKSYHRYEQGTNCKAWLVRILYNLNGKRLRRLYRLRLVENPDEKLAEVVAPERSTSQTITDKEILKALKRIPKQFSQVVVLADVEEFTYREISQILSVPMGTVMSRLSRGRKLLRNELAKYAGSYGIGDAKTAGGTE